MRGANILDDIIVIRGGGDLATGVAQKFFHAGMKTLVLEAKTPLAVRRAVSLCRAVSDGVCTVEDMTARLVKSAEDCAAVWRDGEIPVLVDENAASLSVIRPDGVIDAILAKRNLGTNPAMAPVVIALGPGFDAPRDAHAVIETMRGHTLGKIIFNGGAIPDTGTPGLIGSRAAERVLRAPCGGVIENLRQISDLVNEGDGIFRVGGKTVTAPFAGVLRGLIADGAEVAAGLKTADIDPRADSDCHTISDKARAVGGAALDAYLYLRRKL